MKKTNSNDIHDVVYEYPTKYKEGFTSSELKDIIKQYPNMNMDKFYDALQGITGMVINKEFITYHVDIESAIRCGLENRDLYSWEWD